MLQLRARSTTGPGPQHARRLTRAVSTLLVLVLLALAGLAVSSAYEGERSAERIARSGDLVEAYLTLNRGFAAQEDVEAHYEDGPPLEARARFDAATSVIDSALAVLRWKGLERDRELATVVARLHRRYVSGNHRVFDAIDAGDEERAEEIDDEIVDRVGEAMQLQVSELGPRHATLALSELDARKGSRARVLRQTLIVVGVGLATLGALSWLLAGLRRRLEQATQADLDRLSRAALTDSVTGIPNHRAFREDVDRQLTAHDLARQPLGVVMLDANRLKEVNQRGGHQAGDEYLQSIADALVATAGDAGTVYRVGGDEFAVILPGASDWEAFDFAQRLHAALSRSGPATVTAGVAEALAGDSAEALVKRADTALMDGKRSGQATVRYTPALADVGADLPGIAPSAHAMALGAALARAVDAKDSYTRSHCETVAALCQAIATELKLDPKAVTAVRLAGLVHDVGKIGVPDAILQKPAQLTREEFEVIKGHSALGHKILTGTDLDEQAPWVLNHHERMDGRGYPGGLAGDEIPLPARIIHVADAFEAMTSDRPYRVGISVEDATSELLRHAGTQFDPDCVAALLRSLGRRGPDASETVTRPAVARDESLLVPVDPFAPALGRLAG